ncbi:unnamed protein product [Thelazia callipaeda]|uniref:Essential MCU regulator, mitochondrial n=1 Tax=Thelazia callipaeda TaxID=103827 RepID=A0A0N5CJE7_THECL|nr:unnamed protein product [Thelazia callipaeda]
MNHIASFLLRMRRKFFARSSPPTSISTNLESSPIDSLPYTLPFGIFKLVLVTTSSVGLGAYLAKEAAQFLRDSEIFVPKAEDDDD